MRILCVADDKDNLVYTAKAKEFFPDVDIIIGAGDLSLRYYEFIISIFNKPLFFVFGNHNLEHFKYYDHKTGKRIGSVTQLVSNDVPYGGTMIDDRVYRDKKTGLLIAGLGGSIRYNKGKHQYTNTQMRRRIIKMVPHLIFNRVFYGRYLDILITHAPPLGMNDASDPCHKGFASFLTFMDIFKPKYLVHGHVHLTDANSKRDTVYKRTKIINVYKSFVIDDDCIGRRKKK